jgi:twitching motility protein PilT
VAAIDAIFTEARDAGASDIHLEENQRPKMRQNGQIVAFNDAQVLSHQTIEAWIKEIAPSEQWNRLRQSGECEFAYDMDARSRFRLGCYRHMHGIGAVGRIIPGELPKWDQLGLPPILNDVLENPSGLLIVTGPSGCGKSTTVAALLDQINANQSKRILTVEQPIEFVHPSRQSVVLQREIGIHTRSLQAELKSHQDFDVMFIGELENAEVISCALNAATSGCLVIATLRGSSCAKALEHMVAAFDDEQRQWVRTTLSTSLRCVCAQVLVPKADGTGRCAAHEILIGSMGVASAIRDDHIAKLGGMIQAGGQDGMVTMDDALMKKVEAKLIQPADALVKANDKNRFQALVQKPPEPEEAQPAPETTPPAKPQVAVRSAVLGPKR